MDPQSYMLYTLILVGHAQYFIHYLFKIENFMKGIITYYFQDKCLKYHATFHLWNLEISKLHQNSIDFDLLY